MKCYKFTKSNINLICNFCCGIYAIRNDINNNMYVGSSNNIRNRLNYHLQALIHGNCSNHNLQKAVDIFGIDKFSFIILEECEDNHSTIKYLENKYIEQCGNYNINKVSGKSVHCYSMNGDYITTYDNLLIAAKSIGGFVDNIKGCCEHRKHKKSYKGFQWSYDKKQNIGNWHRNEIYSNCKQVQQLTKDDILIDTYQSIGQASRSTGIAKSAIQSVLNVNKIHKTAGGFKWKYVERRNYE